MRRGRLRKFLLRVVLLGIIQFANTTRSSILTSSIDSVTSSLSQEPTTEKSDSGGETSTVYTELAKSTIGYTAQPETLPVANSTLSPVINVFTPISLNTTIYPNLNNPIFRPVFTNIKHGERHVHPYKFSSKILSHGPAFQLQFYSESEEQPDILESDKDYPLHVAVYWYGSIKSWDIPIHYLNETVADSKTSRYANRSIGKTLWLYPEKSSSKSLDLTIEVSFFGKKSVFYKIRIVALNNFLVSPSKQIIGTATSISSAYFKFDKPPDGVWDYAFVHAVSDTDICTIMIIQQPRGPFLDTEEHQKEKQFTETFTMKSGLTVKMEDFPNGFVIVFIPFLNDEICQRHPNHSALGLSDPFRVKAITFQIREAISPFKLSYYYPMAIPIGLFAVISICALFAMSYFHRYRINRNNKRKPNRQLSLYQRRHTMEYQSNITIDELIITEPSRVVGQTQRYCRAGIVTSAFYSVPVFQLIITFSKRLIESGNFDICYFNHFCSHMLGPIHDFNHMYSNIWYVLFGILFMGLVRIRQATYEMDYVESSEEQVSTSIFNKIFPKTDGRLEVGVMTHYGLLYCMGYALIMTGVMSAAYHICPNQNNFQFDTVFMYTIAAITVVTIYQARHPTYLSANFTFTALALVTCITVLGLLWEEYFIRVIFSVVHMWFLILTLPKVCYNGYVRRNGRLVAHWGEMMSILLVKIKDDWTHSKTFRVQRRIWYHPENVNIEIIPGPGRLVLPSFILFINCAAVISTFTILIKQNFATQVLFICVVNGAFYTIFYSILKAFHGECRDFLWIQPGIYLAFSFSLWGLAMYYFLDEVSTWETSPAESRLKNSDCILFQFYDSHDMWHFLSASALFCSAMVLLTVDDDLLDRHKATIPVF